MQITRVTTGILVAAATYWLSVSCSKIYRLSVLPSPADRIDMANICWSPVAIVSVIERDEDLDINKLVDWNHQKDVGFSLHRLSLLVENVLRGGNIKQNQPVYYFEFTGSYDGPLTLGYWRVPEKGAGQVGRRIFFCRYDRGLLRLSCDGTNDCTISIASGRHADSPELRQADFRRRLAYMKLTKGEGVSNHEFAEDLGKHCGWLDGCSSDLPELRLLMRDPDPEIKRAACDLLVDSESQRLPKARDHEVVSACQEFVKPSR